MDNKEVLLRTGNARDEMTTYFRGPTAIHFTKGGKRLVMGKENYEMGEDGYFLLNPDPGAISKESIIGDPVFSHAGLDAVRAKYLKN